MGSGDRWPSRWWFWAFPAVANLYVALLVVSWQVAMAGRVPLLRVPAQLVMAPAYCFMLAVVRPLVTKWRGAWGLPTDSDLLIGLGLWELGAVLTGLAVYGVASLLYAIIPGEGGKGKKPSDGSG